MKLKLNCTLRAALLSCYAVVTSLTTSLSTGTLAVGTVALTLLSAQHAQAQTTLTAAGGQIPIEYRSVIDDEYIIVDISAGYFGNAYVSWDTDIIYVKTWTISGASGSDSLYAKGNLTDITPELLGEGVAAGTGNIMFFNVNGPGSAIANSYMFDGDHSGFSGDFITAVGNANAFDYVFTNSASTADSNFTAISGTGAIEMGVRTTAVDGLPVNAAAKVAHYFYAGNVSIDNTHINAGRVTLNAKPADGTNTSAAFTTSRNTKTDTGGATYTVNTVLTLNALEVNDDVTAILTKTGSNINFVDLAGTSTFTVGNTGGVSLITGSSTLWDNASMNVLTGGSFTLGAEAVFNVRGTLALETAIINNGTFNVTDVASIDLSNLTPTMDGEKAIYQLAAGTGTVQFADTLDWGNILGIDGLTAASHEVIFDATTGSISLEKINFISYAGSDDPAAPSDLNWDTTSLSFNGGTVAFADGTNVVFSEHTNATLTQAITAGRVTVNANSTLSLSSGGVAANVLTADSVNLSGILTLLDADVLGADVNLVFTEGGKIVLADGTSLNGTNISAEEGATVWFEIVDGGTGTITGQVAGTTSMRASGAGLIVLEGSLLAGASTTTIDAGTTLSVGTGSSSGDLKALAGAGTLEFSGNDGNTVFTTNEFTGTIALKEGASGVILRANQASGNRFDLVYDGVLATSVQLASVGAAGGIANHLHIGNLSGNINFSSGSAADSYKRDTLVLTMTQDNTWSGTWAAGSTQDGGMRVGSATDEHHTLTITQGLIGASGHSGWNGFEIRNATVTFAEGGTWNTSILFADETSELRYEGNSQTIANEGTGEQLDAYVSGSFATANSAGITANNFGSIVVDTGAEANVITVDRANVDYRGTVSVESGTLSLTNAQAFVNASAISISGGVLNFNDHAMTQDIAASGGKLAGLAGYTGRLDVTGAVTIEGTYSPNVSIADTGSLTLLGTWDFNTALANEGNVILGEDMTLDLTGVTFDGDNSVQLVSDVTLLEATDWLTAGGELDIDKVVGLNMEGREYSYENGVIKFTLTGITHLVEGNDVAPSLAFSIEEGTDISGAAMANGDNVTFSKNLDLSVTGDVRSILVTIAEDAFVNVVDTEFTYTMERLALAANSTLNAGGGFATQFVSMAAGSTLIIDSITDIGVDMEGTAELVLNDALAAGIVNLDNVQGESGSELTLKLAVGGTTLSVANFAGTVNVEEGSLLTNTAHFDVLGGVSLIDGTSYTITDVLQNGTHDLSKVVGSGDLSIQAVGDITEAGGGNTDRVALTISDLFTGKLSLASGLIDATDVNLGGSSVITVSDSGFIATLADTDSFISKDIEIVTGSLIARSFTDANLVLSGSITGDATTSIRKTDGGTATLTGDLDGFLGTISARYGKLVVDTDILNASKMSIWGDVDVELTAGHTINTTAKDEGREFYTLVFSHSYDLIIGVGATINDNLYMRMGEGTINISGGGTYNIVGFMGSDGAANRNSILNIAANTTMTVSGDVTSSNAGDLPSFMLSHWPGTAVINVSGTLDVTAGISNRDGTGTINVESGGTLLLGQGLYGIDNGNEAGKINLFAKDGSTVKLFNQATNTAVGVFIADFAGGSTIEALDETTNITNAIRLSGAGAVTLTADAAVTQVNMASIISNVDASTASLDISTKADQTFALSGANTFSTGLNITGAGSVSVENVSGMGAGAVSLMSGTLDLNDLAVGNDITATGGTVTNFANFAGTLTVTGAVDSIGNMGGTIVVDAAGDFTLGGIYKPTVAIDNDGSLTLAADLILDLSDVTLAAGETLSLFANDDTTGISDITAFAPGGIVAHDRIIGMVSIGREFTLTDDGMLSYALTGKELISTTATLAWKDGADIGAEIFNNEDSVTFSTTDAVATLGGDVLAARVTVETGLSLTVDSADPAFTLAVGEIFLEENASMIMDGVALTVTEANLATGSTLSMGSLGFGKATLDGTAALILTDGLAAGEQSLDKIFGGADSFLSVASAATGDEKVTLLTPNFTGSLELTAGAFDSSLAQHGTYASVHLSGTSSYEITDTLAATHTMTGLSAEAGTLLQLNLSAAADAGTTLTLEAAFNGNIEVMSGTLSAFSTTEGLVEDEAANLVNVDKVIFNDATSLVFNVSETAHVFTPDVALADGASVRIRTWGLITEDVLREIDGAVTGAADTTLIKTDAGLTQLNNIVDFEGSIVVENGVGGPGKLIINSAANGLNNITLGTATLLDIVGDTNVVNTATYSGGSTTLIGTGASLVVTGTDTSVTEGEAASFQLVGTVNVQGTLVVGSGISNAAAAGTINVENGATLELKQGLYTAYNTNASTINVMEGAHVKLSDQTTASSNAAGTDAHLVANFAAGSTITAMDSRTNVLNNLQLSGDGVVTLTADANLIDVLFKGVISGTDGQTTGLLITGNGLALPQTFELHAENTFTGLTTVDGNVQLVVAHANALSTGAGVTVTSGELNLTRVEGIDLGGTLSLNTNSTVFMNQNYSVALDGLVLNLSAGEKVTLDVGIISTAEFDVQLFTGLTADGSITGIDFDLEGKADAGDYFDGLLGELTYDKVAGTLSYNNYNLDNLIWKGGSGSFSEVNAWATQQGAFVVLEGTEKSITFEAAAAAATVSVDGVYDVVNMTVKGIGANYTFALADAANSLNIQEKLVVDDGASATFEFAPTFETGIEVLVDAGSTLTLQGTDTISIATFTNNGTITASDYDITLESATTSLGDISAASLNLATGENRFNSVTTTGAVNLGTGGSLELSAASSMGHFTGAGDLTLNAGASLDIAGTANIGVLASSASVSIGAGDNVIATLDNSSDVSSVGNLTITTVTNGGDLTVGTLAVGVTPQITSNLELENAASFDKLVVTGNVDITDKALSIGADSNILGAVTASTLTLTEGAASIGSLVDGAVLSNAGNGTLSILADTDVASFNNAGTVDIDGGFVVDEAVTAGGNLIATGDVVLMGDNSFTSINTDGAITKNAASVEDLSLSVTSDSSASSLQQGMALEVEGTNTVFSLTAATGDTTLSSLSATGSLSIASTGALRLDTASTANNLTLGGSSLSLGAALTLTGDLTTATSVLTLAIDYDIKGGSVLTANGVQAATGLNLDISFSQLDELGLSHQGSYALTDVEEGFASSFDLSFADVDAAGATWQIDNRSYILGVDGTTGQITITLDISGNTWQSVTGIWDNSPDNWDGNLPTAGESAFFLGDGRMDVQVSGDKIVGELRVQGAYSFFGDDISAEEFNHTDATIAIANVITVDGATRISNAGTVMNLTAKDSQNGILRTEYLDITTGAMLKLDTGSAVHVGENAMDVSQVNEILGTIENAGEVFLYGKLQGQRYDIATITGETGELIISESADVTIGTLEQAVVELSQQGSLNLTGDAVIDVLLGAGEIDAAANLTLTGEGSNSTASLDATSLIINGKDNSLGALSVGTLTLNGDLADGAEALLSVGSIEGETAGSSFNLTVGDQLIGLGYGSYTLVSSSAGTLSWGNVTWDADSLGEIQDLVRSGMDITYTDDGATLGFTLSESTNRIWSVSNNFAASEGLLEESPSAVKPIFTATAEGGVLENYRVLDSVDTIVVDVNFTLDLSTQPADIHGAVLRDTMGTATLTLVGGKATLENSKQSMLAGLTLDGTELDVHRSEVAGSITINNLIADGADIEVSEGGRLSVSSATLTDTDLVVGDVMSYSGNASSLIVNNLTLGGDSNVTVLATTTTNRALTNAVALTVTDKLTLNDAATNTVDTGAAESVKQLDANGDSQFIVRDGGQAYIGTADLADNASLSAAGTGYIEIDELTASVETNNVEGHIILGNGVYNGGYSGATTFETKAGGETSIMTDSMVNVVGNQGSDITLRYNAVAGSNDVASLNGTGSTIRVESTGLNVLNTSNLTDSTVHFQVDSAAIVSLLDSSTYDPANAIDLFSDASAGKLTMTNTTIVIDQLDSSITSLDFSNVDTTQELVLFNVNAEGASEKDISFAVGSVYARYFSGVSVDSQGNVTIVFNQEGYVPKASSYNGLAGATMLSPLIFKGQTGDLADVLLEMDTAIGAEADRVAAAAAGASVTSLGSAMLSAVERQLLNVRNRAVSMSDKVMAEEYGLSCNAWISAEGGYSKLESLGTASGHEYNSWGGTFGLDVALTSDATIGFALTTLYGSLNSDAADIAEGDLNTYSLTAYANFTHNSWTHSFLASISMADATLDRTVNLTEGSYRTNGETKGMGVGLMYEVGYDYTLDEEESMTLQPVFNVALVHASMDAYTETGSNAALEVGEQDSTYITFGLGARFEAQIGENAFNRNGSFTSHAMLKFDAGDRYTDADVRFVDQTVTGNVKGSEAGAVGLELGVGFSIPVGEETGVLFMDAGVEIRDQYSNVNGTMGYRFSF